MFDHICQDYRKLIDCYCKIAFMEGTSPDFKKLWNTLLKRLDQVEERVNALSDDLDLLYNNDKNDTCDRVQQLFGQVNKICIRLKQMSEEEHKQLFDSIGELEHELEGFVMAWGELVSLLHEQGDYPCEDGGEANGRPPFGRGTMMLQSRYLYCQATGSDGSDGSSTGMHLRWTFREGLQEVHLPKGDLAAPGGVYQTGIGHNKADDYVRLYRIPYDPRGGAEINFSTPPSRIETQMGRREWHYNVPGFSKKSLHVIVRFMDTDRYNGISVNPMTATKDFIKEYDGQLEVEINEGRLMFAGEFRFRKRPGGCLSLSSGGRPARLYLEVVSAAHGDPGASLSIACRKVYTCSSKEGCMERVVCENIRKFRLKLESGVLESIRVEEYRDFINNAELFELVEELSLTMDDMEAFQRLEDSPRFEIDRKWPQYNDGTTVKSENYRKKWTNPKEGIRKAVIRYLELSRTDLKAVDTLPSDNPVNSSQITVSYLSVLNMMATDFHIARMLGLGHIDTPHALPDGGFVYLAVYHVENNKLYKSGAAKSEYVQLAWMTLPTHPTDHRLPHTPKIRPVRYGLNLTEQERGHLYDDEGYSKFYPVRFVNIGREKYDHEITYKSFFAQDTEFCICERTSAVLYGIEYKKKGEPEYRKPEITSYVHGHASKDYLAHDIDYPEGVAETVPVRDDENSLFIHNEKEAGIHCYALYGINWFSRASNPSGEACTDSTKFPKKNTLIPPSNLAVQYIQEEKTLIFTSQEEQDELLAREVANPGGDNNFVRVTFDYNHAHNTVYQRGDTVRFHFREEMPHEVKGNVVSERDHNGNELLSEVTLGSYNSLETGNPIEPEIPAAMISRFVGGVLRTENEQFTVVDILPGTPYPKLVVELRLKRESITHTETDIETGEEVTTYHNPGGSPVRPKAGDKFLLFENLADEGQWTSLNKTVDIIHFSNHTETLVQEGGEETILTIGGIIGPAAVEDSISLSGINGIEGVYRVTFKTETLADHPDGEVRWYKGVARIPLISNGKRVLEVIRIESQNPLVIWVYDSKHATDPIQTGSEVAVNYHPGYNVWLNPEPANGFDGAHIKPVSDHAKKTLIGVQSSDLSHTPDYHSTIGVPAVLLAQRLIEPEPPGVPSGPTFATRPDFYGKSTYTFDVEVNTSGREPFGFIFFRADDTAVLNALYKPSTLRQIRTKLEDLEPNEFSVDRFNDLVNVVFDTDPNHSGEFKEYDGYRMPEPDREGLLDGDESVDNKCRKLKSAVTRAFVPLTEHPPLYQFIKTGRETEGIPPKIKDANGDLLDPGDPNFNPFPMVRKFNDNGTSYVRFTDNTLDGTSVNRFFYYGVEISPKLTQSEPGPISGPIDLVNTYAPEAPVVKRVIPQTANPVEQKEPAIYFGIEPYVESELVEKVRIYRATDEVEAQSVRTMTLAVECPLDEIVDRFEDVPFPLFGEMLHYRLVALRRIVNEQGEEEWVPSKPSELFMTNLVDVVNPEAPTIQISHSGLNTSNELTNVVLSWNPTCYNGNYHLYKLNNKGQWGKVKSFLKKNSDVNFTVPTNLPKKNEKGEQIYHSFRVDAVNASGLGNIENKRIVL